MFFFIRHVTSYDFSGSVFLEPHTLLLFPRCDGTQKILNHDLNITPAPAGLSRGLDIWGNSFALAWFNGQHRHLQIDSSIRIETLRDNPFDYYLPEQSTVMPISLRAHERAALGSSLERLSTPEEDTDSISSIAEFFLKSTHNNTLSFLAALNAWLFNNFKRVERSKPGIINPPDLMRSKTGSCRDLAVLFVEICRVSGIPARLVSGYQEGDPDISEAELHAWAEVYLPGAGWRGYDPTHGLVVADRHIPLAAAPEPEHTLPVSGTFRGTGIFSRIEHQVTMTVSSQA